MAPKACSPYANRRFIRSIEEESAVLSGYIKSIGDLQRNMNPGKGYMNEMSRRATNRLRTMLAMPMESVIGFLADEGALTIKTLKNGDQVLMNAKGDPQDLGEWAAAMKVYLQGQAGGIRQLADNFIIAAENGEGALVQGVELAKQLSWMGQLGESIVGYDQSLGRGLLAQKFAKGGFNPAELAEKIAKSREARMAQAAVEGAGEYSDKIGDIIKRLNDPQLKDGALDDLYELAEQIKFMNDPINIVKGTTGLKMAGNAWNEFFINGMLSSPSTWATNAAGVLWAPMRVGAQLFGAKAMQIAAAAGVGDAQVARGVWEMSLAQVAGMRSSLRDAAIMGWQALETGRSVYWDDASIDATRAISGANFNDTLNRLGRESTSEGVKETIDNVGRFIRIPSRVLTATDEFAKIITQRGEVAQRAVKRAIDDGVDMNDTAAIKAYMEAEAKLAFELGPETRFGSAKYGQLRTVYDKASGLQEGFGNRTISRVGEEATFQERGGTFASNVAGKVTNALEGPYGAVLRPFMPFVRTPMNIIGQGIGQATPLGPMTVLAKSAFDNRLSVTGTIMDMQQKMLQSPTETARITGQIALMTATGATLVGMAMEGRMTGGGPTRWAKEKGPQARMAQKVWEENNTPYSIRLSDDLELPIDRFPEPVATLMRIAADLGEASAYMTQEERDEAFGVWVAISATGMWNSSALTGFDRLTRLFRDPASFDQELAKNVQYWFSTQTPMAGLMSWVNKQADPYERAYQTTNTKYLMNMEEVFGRGVFGKIAERFPGGGATRPVQIDQLYGEPVPIVQGVGPGGVNPLLEGIPFVPRKRTGDEAWQAVWEIAGTWKDYKPSGVELTTTEQMELNRQMGTMVIDGLTLSQAIMRLRRRPDVEQLVTQRGLATPDTEFGAAKELARLRSKYGRAAFMKMQRGSVSLQQRVAVGGVLNEQERSNNYVAARTTSQQLKRLIEEAEAGQ